MAGFMRVDVAKVPRLKKLMANTLAALASNALYTCHVELTIMTHPSIHNAEIHTPENRAENS